MLYAVVSSLLAIRRTARPDADQVLGARANGQRRGGRVPSVEARQLVRFLRAQRLLAGQRAQAVDPLEDRRMRREEPRRARLELLDGVREVQVLRPAVGDLEHL